MIMSRPTTRAAARMVKEVFHREACVGGPAPDGQTRFSTSLTVVAFRVAIAMLSFAEVGMVFSAG